MQVYRAREVKMISSLNNGGIFIRGSMEILIASLALEFLSIIQYVNAVVRVCDVSIAIA